MKIRKLSLILSAILGLGLIGPAVASAQLGSSSATSADVATDASVRFDAANSNDDDDDGLLGLGILGNDNSDDSNDDGLLGGLLGGNDSNDSNSGLLGGL